MERLPVYYVQKDSGFNSRELHKKRPVGSKQDLRPKGNRFGSKLFQSEPNLSKTRISFTTKRQQDDYKSYPKAVFLKSSSDNYTKKRKYFIDQEKENSKYLTRTRSDTRSYSPTEMELNGFRVVHNGIIIHDGTNLEEKPQVQSRFFVEKDDLFYNTFNLSSFKIEPKAEQISLPAFIEATE